MILMILVTTAITFAQQQQATDRQLANTTEQALTATQPPPPAPIVIQTPIRTSPSNLKHFPPTLVPKIPYDVDAAAVRRFDRQGSIQKAQRLFDIHSWQAFIAINWPMTSDERPRARLSNSGPLAWEHWITGAQIFRPRGAAPAPWGRRKDGDLQLFRVKAAWRQHTSPVIDQSLQAFSGPLASRPERQLGSLRRLCKQT